MNPPTHNFHPNDLPSGPGVTQLPYLLGPLSLPAPGSAPTLPFCHMPGPLDAPSSPRIPFHLNWIHVLSSPLSFFEPQMYQASASFVANWLETPEVDCFQSPQ